MVYIPENGKITPGNPLGDAKTMETRTVPYELNPDGTPKYEIAPGKVVYIDDEGYAVPYDRKRPVSLPTPYGVVWMMTKFDPEAPSSSGNTATVRVVTQGVVAVTCYGNDTSAEPRLGYPVNQYGCWAGGTEANERVIGVCDGIGTDPKDPEQTVAAVRLTAGAAAATTYKPSKHVKVKNVQGGTGNDDDDGTIPAYAPVRLVQGTDPDGPPSAKQWTTEAQQLYGYAAEEIPPGETGYVVVSGKFELPYVNADTVADKNAVSQGYQVVWIPKDDGEWWQKALVIIRDVAVTVGVVAEALGKVFNVRREINSGYTVDGDRKTSVYGKTTANGKGDEPVIDGWLTVDVNPQNAHAPMSMDYAVAEDATVTLTPGHVYSGTDSGVREYETNWDGGPFFGVCTGLPSLIDGKTPFLREGVIDVVAADDWGAGDYIDYTRHAIPEAYEPYVPHIGVAVADTAAGELGAVHLRPWDPNEYIVLDYVHISGSVSALENKAVYRSVTSMYPSFQECIQIVPTSNEEAGYTGFDGYPTITGILRRGYKNFHPDYAQKGYAYGDRAIIQVGGYAWCTLPSTATLPSPGQPVTHMGPDWIRTVWFSPHDLPEASAYAQLGTVLSTFTDAEATADTVIVKLDIKHHPNMEKESDPLRAPIHYAVAEDATVTLTPGHVYGGSNSGVREYGTNYDGMPFFGVCTVLPSLEDDQTPFLREGVANVEAYGDWNQGDYIDYTRHAIPEAYEPYVPHIGVAVADTAEGELGAVLLQPWDPNEYIVLDHVKIMGTVTPDTSVYQVGRMIMFCSHAPAPNYFEGNYPSLRGVLRRGIKDLFPDDPAGYADRVIIQTDGYVGLLVEEYQPRDIVGYPIRALGSSNTDGGWIDVIDSDLVGKDAGYIQLGIVVSTYSYTGSFYNDIIVKLDIKHHPKIEETVDEYAPASLGVRNAIPMRVNYLDVQAVHYAHMDDARVLVKGLDDILQFSELATSGLELVAVPANDNARDLEFSGVSGDLIAPTHTSSMMPNEWDLTLDHGFTAPDIWRHASIPDTDAVIAYELQYGWPNASTGVISNPIVRRVVNFYVASIDDVKTSHPDTAPEVNPEPAEPAKVAEAKAETTAETKTETKTKSKKKAKEN